MGPLRQPGQYSQDWGSYWAHCKCSKQEFTSYPPRDWGVGWLAPDRVMVLRQVVDAAWKVYVRTGGIRTDRPHTACTTSITHLSSWCCHTFPYFRGSGIILWLYLQLILQYLSLCPLQSNSIVLSIPFNTTLHSHQPWVPLVGSNSPALDAICQ